MIAINGMPAYPVAWKEWDSGPGPPHRPCIRTVYLFQTFKRTPGVYQRRFFLSQLETLCGNTWISDEDAELFMRENHVLPC